MSSARCKHLVYLTKSKLTSPSGEAGGLGPKPSDIAAAGVAGSPRRIVKDVLSASLLMHQGAGIFALPEVATQGCNPCAFVRAKPVP